MSKAMPERKARDFFSVAAEPITQLRKHEPIENFVTPPELHMRLGIFVWLLEHSKSVSRIETRSTIGPRNSTSLSLDFMEAVGHTMETVAASFCATVSGFCT